MSGWKRIACTALIAAAGCGENCSCLVIRAVNPRVRREVFHQAASAAHLASKIPPAPAHPGKGTFGDAIEYLGYDAQPATPLPGAPVAITFYFHALRDIDRDWQIFVHIEGRGGRINGDHWPVSNQFHTDQWKQGDYIADRFAFAIPSTEAHGTLELWSGFYQGDERLPITNPQEARNDGNNRLLAATLSVQ
jgi:hypothetical protein